MLTIKVPNLLIAETITPLLEAYPVFLFEPRSFQKVVIDFSDMGGSFLNTRELGRQVRQQLLVAAEEQGKVTVDFTDVELASQ